ncbi:benzoate/H(+) symporter BenE family transporter [Microbaculum marinisediminis]|uniref:Benzoate/H(+) symporter BenE family transporter n=1 Tax=Microbaculum marinisediminis TaxID=2931392 RepID=A0AAW5QTZ0_9HYPH|nr:benzoate/H(+) symporter BenE family transporter [Microbaculum sp. A6E488]MCT8971148.1 benzoate/H(+) symporter BenE family transporter [Microbaculum sp. A6E488]
MSDVAVSSRLSYSAIGAGTVAAFVGFGSSFPVVVQGLTAVGASNAEAASGLMAMSILMGLAAILLSWRSRQPVSVAWSTPGAALLISTGAVAGGFSAAVGAFLITGLLIVVAALVRPFRDLVAAIPSSIANAMLAGIILELCLAPVQAIGVIPQFALPVIVVWAVMLRVARLYAMPVAVVVTAAIIMTTTELPVATVGELLPAPVLIAPSFTWGAVVSLAIPLFVVTMASQNVPGIAVLQAYGYRTRVRESFLVTGVGTMIGAPFGGQAINYAAITAAICAGPDADPDPARRWVAAFAAGVLYVGFGFAATFATVLIAASPPLLIQAVAGLALMGALGNALLGAMREIGDRDAAIVTFVVSASGLSFFGIGAAFWGLVAGGAMLALSRWRQEKTDD